MRKFFVYFSVLSFLSVAGFSRAGSENSKFDGFFFPSGLVADAARGRVYIALETAKGIAVFDNSSNSIVDTFELPACPSGLALSADGSRLFVTTKGDDGLIFVIDTADGTAEYTIAAGHFPCAPVLSSDESKIYICNRFQNSVGVFDVTTKQKIRTVPVGREPVGAVITNDGKQLLVANSLPKGTAHSGYISTSVSVIDTTSAKAAANIELGNGTTNARGICIGPDGRYAYVTHILGRYWNPTTQLERGWMNTNAMSIIDIGQMKLLNTVLVDEIDSGGANPWGIASSQEGKYICIAHAGTHEISLIDRAGLHEKLRSIPETASGYSSSYAGVRNDLSFLVGLRKEIKLSGNGPRELVIIGTKVYISEYYSDSVAVVDIGADVSSSVKSIRLGSPKPLDIVRKGEMLFNDASLCFQNWQSCGSCHPDGRADGLNWDLLNDGIGNPKQTKSMLFAHKTPPAMVSGVRDTAEEAVRSGIKFIQFVQRPESDAAAIDEYLKSLRPVGSPYLVSGGLTESAERGKVIFENAGCGKCHPAPLYTDMDKHEVGTGTGRDSGRRFDTPTLAELWRTGPYLYDGRAETVKDVLIKFNDEDSHGETSKLTGQQIDDLEKFLLSL